MLGLARTPGSTTAQQLQGKQSKHVKPTKLSLRGEVHCVFALCCLLARLSTLSALQLLNMASTTKRADFEAIFPSLAQDILAHAKRYNLPPNALEWFEKVGQCPSMNFGKSNCEYKLTLFEI